VAKCEEAMSKETEQTKEYRTLIDSFSQKIDGMKDEKTANALLKELGKAGHLWDSKARLWESFLSRAKALKLAYDSKTKKIISTDPETTAAVAKEITEMETPQTENSAEEVA
jgi:predicted  nucleic acid-binding Zn-ribbon protein